MNIGKQFKEGLTTQNPVTVQLLGMCSTMAITTSLFNGIGMGISVLIILTCSNVVISMLRKLIPDEIRIACFIVVIAGLIIIRIDVNFFSVSGGGRYIRGGNQRQRIYGLAQQRKFGFDLVSGIVNIWLQFIQVISSKAGRRI